MADPIQGTATNTTEAPYKSGCELLTSTTLTHPTSSPLQQVIHAFHQSTQYFTISYLGPHRGYGAIASTDIPKHTLILEEPPLLPCDVLETALDKYTDGSLSCYEEDTVFLRRYFEALYGAVDGMEEDGKKAEVQILIDLFWSMHDQYAVVGDDGTNVTSKRIWGINYSNAFFNAESLSTINNQSTTTTTYRPTIHFLAAKLNHSCKPNVGYDFNQNNQRMFTTRDIQRGEELCDCYSDVVYHEPSYVRQLFLKAKYNFDCECEACSYPAVEREESDERRIYLREIAMSLSGRIGANFLYNHQFAKDVQRIAYADDHASDSDDEYETSWNCNHPNSANKLKPSSDDLYTLLEYIDILKKEGVDHDILECMELAFDLAVFLDDRLALQQYGLGDNVLQLYELTKGEKHKKTRLFRKKLDKMNRSLK